MTDYSKLPCAFCGAPSKIKYGKHFVCGKHYHRETGKTFKQAVKASTRRKFAVSQRKDHLGNKFTKLEIPEGYIEIAEKSPYAQGRNSIVRFYIHEPYRGKGLSKELLRAAKRRYNNLSAQASNEISVRSLYSSGFRGGNKTLQELLAEMRRVSSVLLIWRRKR
jgi:GNAT superfamily N-acetyltransferase